MNFPIRVYPRVRKPKQKQSKNFLVLLFPDGSDIALLQSEHFTLELAERSVRAWLELEPDGKWEIYDKR